MAASKCRWRAGLCGTGNLRAVLGLRTRRLPQECLGQGASAGRVLRHRGPRYNYAHIQPLRQVLHHDQRGHALQLPRFLSCFPISFDPSSLSLALSLWFSMSLSLCISCLFLHH
ncbi:NADH dehydrogenase [ubiquinone] 1 alpha subcomplex subunit 3 isoform X4 [Macaca thibetana thibetana]|uniref:NADH dehydrogenase [ubiquinone] 1 alpha subcomplex subunit 3 isoform X4 n=1 Tax=Macaca thibetana thibetana TaxID=257877 RepID=UPI0021BC3E57|nr:NADH dehydrogenase [ubiquinone] 1 alpha subcomplex subunit 3 isoform X4 [Macaca thibetana thibetana]